MYVLKIYLRLIFSTPFLSLFDISRIHWNFGGCFDFNLLLITQQAANKTKIKKAMLETVYIDICAK